jgi:hypothetical protein
MVGIIAHTPKGALDTSEDSTAIFGSLAGHVPRSRLITIPVPAVRAPAATFLGAFGAHILGHPRESGDPALVSSDSTLGCAESASERSSWTRSPGRGSASQMMIGTPRLCSVSAPERYSTDAVRVFEGTFAARHGCGLASTMLTCL